MIISDLAVLVDDYEYLVFPSHLCLRYPTYIIVGILRLGAPVL